MKKKQKGKGWQSYIPRFQVFNQKCIVENLRSKVFLWNSERHPAYRKVAIEDVQSTTFTLCLRALQLLKFQSKIETQNAIQMKEKLLPVASR